MGKHSHQGVYLIDNDIMIQSKCLWKHLISTLLCILWKFPIVQVVDMWEGYPRGQINNKDEQ